MQFKELIIPEKYVDAGWNTKKIKIMKWTLGVRNKILGECSKMKISHNGTNTPDFEWTKYQILSIVHSVTEAPWKTGDIVTVADLDPNLGDWLLEEINNFNEGDTKNRKDSQGSIEEKQEETQTKSE